MKNTYNHRFRLFSRGLYLWMSIIILLFFGTIFFINLHSAQWYHYDIYADAMVAKYMWESGTLFPEGWVFGNQFYVVATPALAAMIYGITANSTLSLGIASCIMTVLILLSFLWCIGPFVKKENLLVGILCLIGGTLLSNAAIPDSAGMPYFFTMASYYACYLIGILFTVGIWLRLYFQKSVSPLLCILCFLLNVALSMQSLREMLVLNLPLCALAFLLTLLTFCKKAKNPLFSKSNCFALAMLLAGILGLVVIHVLKHHLAIGQNDILQQTDASLWNNVQTSIAAFLEYAGLYLRSRSLFSIFRFLSSALIICVVLFSMISVLRKPDVTPLGVAILFCIISLCAVFCAGLLFITVRSPYYFVWHFLVVLSFTYTAEQLHLFRKFRTLLLTVLLLISSASWFFQFYDGLRDYASKQTFYEDICSTLADENITHVYYEVYGMFQAPRVAALTEDRILYVPFCLQETSPEEENSNLLRYPAYLYHSGWYSPENQDHAYIMLSGEVLAGETGSFDLDALLSHLTLVHHFSGQGEDHYFYKFDDAIFQDIISD